MKRIFRFGAFALIAVFSVLLVCTAFTACDSTEKTETVFLSRAQSQDGYSTFVVDDPTDFKIALFSDPQIDNMYKSHALLGGSNEDTYLFLEYMTKAIDPDLVVIAGDLVVSRYKNNVKDTMEYAALFERLGVYWMPIFGNHDCETKYVKAGLQITNTELIAMLAEYPHCLIEEGDAGEGGGLGNYFVNIRSTSGRLIYTLCGMDTVSNDETNGYYSQKTTAQVEWYQRHINALSDAEYGQNRSSNEVVRSMVFAHVPIAEVEIAYSLYEEGSHDVTYHYGERVESMTSEDCDFFERAKELGSTTAMFFGHYHSNGFSLDYDGIRLTMGQHSSLIAYYRASRVESGKLSPKYSVYDFSEVDTYGDDRGATVITIYSEKDYDISPYYAKQWLKEYADIGIDYAYATEKLTEMGTKVIRGEVVAAEN